MAGVFGEFRVEDLEASVAQLNQFAELMGSRTEILEIMGAFGESTAKGRIDRGGPGPDGNAWAAHSLKWALQTYYYASTGENGLKVKKKQNHPFLKLSGDLYKSIVFDVLNDESVEFGSNLVYAAVHNFGSSNDDPHNIPAREYIGFSADEINELEQILADWSQSKLEGLN